MLLVDEGAPLARVLVDVCERLRALGAPLSIDDEGRELDGDELAAFARCRLAQGLGLPTTPAWGRRRS